MFMGARKTGEKCVVIIRDDFSSYVRLLPTKTWTEGVDTEALNKWTDTLGTLELIVSDQGTNFLKRIRKSQTGELRSKYHLTTAYFPCENGSFERVCRKVLRELKEITNEFRISPKDWPAVFECVQSITNQSPINRTGLRSADILSVYRTPIEFLRLRNQHAHSVTN